MNEEGKLTNLSYRPNSDTTPIFSKASPTVTPLLFQLIIIVLLYSTYSPIVQPSNRLRVLKNQS